MNERSGLLSKYTRFCLLVIILLLISNFYMICDTNFLKFIGTCFMSYCMLFTVVFGNLRCVFANNTSDAGFYICCLFFCCWWLAPLYVL